MTVREAADRLEISASLVYRLVETGRLRCTRHGLGRGVIRISEAQVADYLASAERGAAPDPPQAPAPRAGALKHLRL